MNAWLITWEGTTRGITDENKIIAIIGSQRSHSFIEDLVDTITQMSSKTAYEMAYLANRKRKRIQGSKVMNTSSIIFGSNPSIYARQVKDLKITRNPKESTETIVWYEHEEYRRDPDDAYKQKLIESSKKVQVTRHIDTPLLQCRPRSTNIGY